MTRRPAWCQTRLVPLGAPSKNWCHAAISRTASWLHWVQQKRGARGEQEGSAPMPDKRSGAAGAKGPTNLTSDARFTAQTRAEFGRAQRQQTPRSLHAVWTETSSRL